MQKDERPDTEFDVRMGLYMWESIICMVIIFWTLSLLLDHIKLYTEGEKIRISKALQETDTKRASSKAKEVEDMQYQESEFDKKSSTITDYELKEMESSSSVDI